MPSPTLRGLALSAVVPLALGLTACGSAHSTTATDSQRAVSTSASTSGTRVSPMEFRALLATAVGKITTAHIALTAGASGEHYSLRGVLDLTGSKPAAQLQLSTPAGGMSGAQLRVVGGTAYLDVGALTHDAFVKVDLSGHGSPLGSLGAGLGRLDPSHLLGSLPADAFQHVTYLGTDQRGRHYRATVDLARWASQWATLRASHHQLPSSMRASLPKTLSYDVWLDAQGRISRVQAGDTASLGLVATFSDFGAPVHVVAPPASDVTTFPMGAAAR